MTASNGLAKFAMLMWLVVMGFLVVGCVSGPSTPSAPMPQPTDDVFRGVAPVVDAQATLAAHQAILAAEAEARARATMNAEATISAEQTISALATTQRQAELDVQATGTAVAVAEALATTHAIGTQVAESVTATVESREEQIFQVTLAAAELKLTQEANDADLAFQADQLRLVDIERQLQTAREWEETKYQYVYPAMAVLGFLALVVLLLIGYGYAQSKLEKVIVIDAPADNQHVFIQRGLVQLPAPRQALLAPPSAALPRPSFAGVPDWGAVIEYMRRGKGALIPLGVEAKSGSPIVIDRTRRPHLTFAGTVGGGKSSLAVNTIAAELAAGVAVIAINFKGGDLRLSHPNLFVLPRFADYADAVPVLGRLFKEMVAETVRRDEILERTGARNWIEVPDEHRDTGELRLVVDEFLSIVDRVTVMAEDARIPREERVQLVGQITDLWSDMRQLMGEARKYGIFITTTLTDPTREGLGKEGRKVMRQSTRIAVSMESAQAAISFMGIGAGSGFPQGTVGFEAGEFLINDGVLKHGRGFHPSSAEIAQLFAAVPAPNAILPVGVARAISRPLSRPLSQPVVIEAAKPPEAIDAEQLDGQAGKIGSRNGVALFLAGRQDLQKADGDMYARGDKALRYRAERGCVWAQRLMKLDVSEKASVVA